MEVALASWFDYRTNLIVPGVHWGLNMHECDLLMVSKAGYCTEIEIKISKSDLKADIKKKHGHRSNKIKYLYFAVPVELAEAAIEFAPKRAGILTVLPKKHADMTPRVRRIREPVCNPHTLPMNDREQYKVARLGALRIWNLKRKLNGNG
jgi:hypothetical protein